MSLDWKANYRRWASCSMLDAELRKQMDSMQDNETLLEECFYKNIDFGTGGMRGEMGPGPNRINRYTVRKATLGLVHYLVDQYPIDYTTSVVIAYDSRRHSQDFAYEAAVVLGSRQIRVYLFDSLCPTPLLSYAVRHLQASMGIVITASHNPPIYNGYKVYGPDGAQITLKAAEQLMARIQEVDDELAIETMDASLLQQQGWIRLIGSEILNSYLNRLQNLRYADTLKQPCSEPVRVVFTPLHGTTQQVITRGLQSLDYIHLTCVKEQMDPDPNFSHAPSVNPEEEHAYSLAIRYAKEACADFIIVTDPDGDRLGVAVKASDATYPILTGNQIGALLLDYILEQRKAKGQLPENSVMIKTIVTSELGRVIAKHYGVQTVEVLTGFKYIGEKIGEYEASGDHHFLFGYEESNGYLIGDFVRDKDAVQAALILTELCASLKAQGKTLYGALDALYQRYGCYVEDLHSLTCKGLDGMKQMEAILSSLREHPPARLADCRVIAIEDYLCGERTELASGQKVPLSLPSSNVVKLLLEKDGWLCVRPSGTEPKIKLYVGAKGKDQQEAQQHLAALKAAMLQRWEQDLQA